MNQTVLPQLPTRNSAVSLARLSLPHGYRFDGDNVQLHARLTVLDRAAYQRTWALQLWACPSRPTCAGDLAGQVVAEIALPPMSELADEIEHMDMSTFARPPAGAGEHFIALVLAAGVAGRFDEVHDIVTYPQLQKFLQPRIQGSVSYRIDGNRVHLSVEHVENPRDSGNRSGSLALELWALSKPYAGGDFQGAHLAGVGFGPLSGETELGTNSFDLPFVAPPAGHWHFVLMLREWTAAGYVTRDFTNFANPVNYGQVLESSPAPKITESPVPASGLPGEPAMPAKVLPVAPISIPPVSPVAEAAAVSRKTSASKSAPKGPTSPAVATPPPAPVAMQTVSVNSATEEALAAIDGLSPRLARAIKKGRPFASLDDLRRVKGLTAGILEKIRSRLRV
jgi:Helix-hairpin-helix motif